MSKPKIKEHDMHHIIPSSRAREGFDTGHELNLKRIRRTLHERIHGLFSNMTPQEQLELWYDINKVVLHSESREQIQGLILEVKNKFYREEVLRCEPVLHRNLLPNFED